MSKVFCINCGTKTPYDIHFSDGQFEIRDVKVECMVETAVCRQCGGTVYVPEINDINCELMMEAFLKVKEDA